MEFGTLNNYVDGEWVESSAEMLDVDNPATGEVIARVPLSTAEETAEAVVAAKAAFREWRETPAIGRARYMFRLKEAMEDNFEEYEPTDDELREMEELIRQAEEEENQKDAKENRIFYESPNFSSFCQWLKKNGIRW